MKGAKISTFTVCNIVTLAWPSKCNRDLIQTNKFNKNILWNAVCNVQNYRWPNRLEPDGTATFGPVYYITRLPCRPPSCWTYGPHYAYTVLQWGRKNTFSQKLKSFTYTYGTLSNVYWIWFICVKYCTYQTTLCTLADTRYWLLTMTCTKIRRLNTKMFRYFWLCRHSNSRSARVTVLCITACTIDTVFSKAICKSNE